MSQNELPEVINVDFDKTLTDPDECEWSEAHKREPNREMVDAVRQAYISGCQVIVWTARQWYEAPQVAGWLTSHEVPYHGLRCSKGGSDLYIDDKAMTPEEFLEIV